MSEIPPSPPTATIDAANADAPAAQAPALDLGSGFAPLAFSPGRYAVVIARRMFGTHARNVVKETSTASLVLDLAADGSATACRGWRNQLDYDGPSAHTSERFRLQQGFRGRHVARDGEVDVELTADVTACALVRKPDDSAPERSPTMKLRCVLAAPRGHASLTEPVLLCEWNEPRTLEVEAYLVQGIVPGPWMVLGSGNGLRIAVTGAPVSTTGDPVAVVVEPAAERIEADAWERDRVPVKSP